MSKIQMFEKPLGMRDSFPEVNEQKEYIRLTARDFIRRKGYDFIKTPSVEYFETIGKASAIDESSLFKLVDNQGEMLVLRPDMTTPIARIAASKLLKEKNPLRLAYYADVFRAQQREGGRPAEFEQLGLELIGDFSPYADSEIIYTAIELLKDLGVEGFRITIGHAEILTAFLTNNTNNNEEVELLRQLLVEKNLVGFSQMLESMNLLEEQKDRLSKIIEFTIDSNVFSDFRQFLNDDQQYLIDQVEELQALLEFQLNDFSVVSFDFSLASHMSYYTGMLFEIHAAGSGFSIGNGGRYDELFKQFNEKVGATGFGIRVDRLLEVLPKQLMKEKRTLLLFDKGSFSKANVLAEARRNASEYVTLQYAESVSDIEAFKQIFDEVIIVSEGGSFREE
ncbi:ATP phosphoribosyltransferase regulatory subunit [Psychrobacillus psychrotolerans]|uniref:ATP phosphoribosyltransferase regulatory subunit n=1 Tax=Psychrobacillus psychrotolerans TaxID=126156 RepID=A0A1I5ZXY6_9BACI|nr:ATP phosphoribosyltransferase regulatory subunit [Psychrobacillus psychrotolerans]SFQ61252.1 ATP phosphoribosyltransferase regulatory subunit [Psychrobacillus psychrotolerans]